MEREKERVDEKFLESGCMYVSEMNNFKLERKNRKKTEREREQK